MEQITKLSFKIFLNVGCRSNLRYASSFRRSIPLNSSNEPSVTHSNNNDLISSATDLSGKVNT